ncbi:MAG: NAD(P)/FAD-dependent oxidoreductase [Rhodospirillales bacterium]
MAAPSIPRAIPRGGHIAVIGAGAVGAATALMLRRAGYSVELLDRGEPGMGASYGNAGYLSKSGVVPTATPGILWKVPGLLLDPLGPLTIRWRHLPRMLPWLWKFVRASTPARCEEISLALTALLRHGHDCYAELLGRDEFEEIAPHRGILYVYESDRGFEGSRWANELRRRRGVEWRYVAREEIRQIEPALSPIFRHAIHIPDMRHLKDPLRLTRAIVGKFADAGGEVARAEVTGVERRSSGALALSTTGGRRPCDGLVIAAGAWSRLFASQCGVDVPLDTERGYHVTIKRPNVAPRMPVGSGDRHFGASPMELGLRLAGTDELGGLAAPPNWERARLLQRQAARMFEGLDATNGEFWMGFRPSMPDSLPVIGPAPGNPRVHLAFGHGHLGVTFAAVTARLVADMIRGEQPLVDPAPYRPDRF